MDNQSKTSDYNSEFELPYYHWESELNYKGNLIPIDPTQGFHLDSFRGFFTYTNVPDEERLLHIRMKK